MDEVLLLQEAAELEEIAGQAESGRDRPLAITAADIKTFISPKLYSELSWDDRRESDEVTGECIEKALVLAETLLHLVGEPLNLFSKTQQEAVKTLTVYELYRYNGDRCRAKEYMERAEKLISDRYRSVEKAREAAVPFIALTKAQKGGSVCTSGSTVKIP